MRRWFMAGVLAAAAPALAGCSADRTALTAASADYSCEDIVVPGHTQTEGRRASELSAAGRKAVLQIQGVTRKNLATWRIVEDSTARVTIIRPLARPETLAGKVVASHQYVDRQPARKSDPVRPAWMISIPLTCALREVRAGPVAAQPARPAKPKAKNAPAKAGPGRKAAASQRTPTAPATSPLEAKQPTIKKAMG